MKTILIAASLCLATLPAHAFSLEGRTSSPDEEILRLPAKSYFKACTYKRTTLGAASTTVIRCRPRNNSAPTIITIDADTARGVAATQIDG